MTKETKKHKEISGTAIALITLLILLGVMIYSGSRFLPILENSKTTIVEEPIEKNRRLLISGGESYTYEFRMENTSFNITYHIVGGGTCTMIKTEESIGTDTCIGPDGTDAVNTNASLSNPTVILFKPWMLAVDEGWRWNISMVMEFDGYTKEIDGIKYSTVRIEEYRGRKAYVVKLSPSEGPDTFLWIDENKRILLKEIGKGYEVELIEGLGFEG